MPFPDGYAQEEWFGLFSQGKRMASPFLRVPRKAYADLKAIWNEKLTAEIVYAETFTDGKEGEAKDKDCKACRSAIEG